MMSGRTDGPNVLEADDVMSLLCMYLEWADEKKMCLFMLCFAMDGYI